MYTTGGTPRLRREDRRGARAPAALTAMLTCALLVGAVPALADEPGTEVAAAAAPAAAPSDPAGTGTGAPVAPDTSGHGHQPAVPAPGETTPATPPPLTGVAPDGAGSVSAAFVPVWRDPAVVPDPPANEDLPLEVDEKAPFAQQISCDPLDRPGVTAFALLVSEHYGRPAFSGARPCIDYASFHHDGRALDWPLAVGSAHDRMIADSLLTWLTDNDGEMAKRFGMEYVIWNGLVYYVDGRGWQFYDGDPHTDHIHFSFSWDGAQMRTSWWTGVAVTEPDLGPCDVNPWSYAAVHQFPRLTPCDPTALVTAPATGLGQVRPGESGGGVAMLQGVLGMPQTGVLDEPTRQALLAWQDEHQLPQTGVADDHTYAAVQGHHVGEVPDDARAVTGKKWQRTEFTALRRTTLTEGDQGDAVRLLQEAVGAEPDGDFGPVTAAALAEWEATIPALAEQAERRGDGPAVVTPLTWLHLERAVHPTIALRDIELRVGSMDQVADPEGSLAAQAPADGRTDSPYAGGAVTVLQELLGIDADGSFGPATEAAVRAVQETADLERTGVVDGPTWVAVEERALAEGRLAGSPGAQAAAQREAAEKKAAKKQAAEEKAAKKAAEEKAKKQAAQEQAERRARAAAEAARSADEAAGSS